MKIVIAGSRHIANVDLISECLRDSCWMRSIDLEIGVGCARGVDTVAEDMLRGSALIVQFPADWKAYGKSAGLIRNARMAAWGDRLIAIGYSDSRGTQDMVRRMLDWGKPVAEYVVGSDGSVRRRLRIRCGCPGSSPEPSIFFRELFKRLTFGCQSCGRVIFGD